MHRFKIVILIGQLDRGGAEQQLFNLVTNLDFDVLVISLSSGGYWASILQQRGHRVIELERKGRADVTRLWKIWRLLIKEKPDLVHLFLDSISGPYVRLPMILIRRCAFFIGERSDPRRYPLWYRILSRLTNWRVSKLICNSYAAQKASAELKLISVDRIVMIPNGVLFHKFARVLQSDVEFRFATKARTFVVGTVGHMTAIKNPLAILRIAKYVVQSCSQVKFIIVGNGPLFEDVMKNVGGELDKVVTLYREYEDIPELMKSLDLFLLTSRQEGMPNALLEAMASGLPCIVTDAGDCKHLVEESGAGFAFNVNDEVGIAECIVKLASNPNLRRAMGHAAQLYAKQFDINSMADRYSALYMDSIIGRGAKYEA